MTVYQRVFFPMNIYNSSLCMLVYHIEGISLGIWSLQMIKLKLDWPKTSALKPYSIFLNAAFK